MMQSYDHDQLGQIIGAFGEVRAQANGLAKKFLCRNYNSTMGREFAIQGFVRRVALILQSIENIFSLLPPEIENFPPQSTLQNVVLLVQANIMNVAASVDNLAWVWVYENNLTGANGKDLARSWVGLGPGHEFLRSTFSEEFRKLLQSLQSWFEYHSDFRDAFAHRIPLYIPPYNVHSDGEEAKAIQEKMVIAESLHDFEQHFRLGEELKHYANFRPYILHSLNSNSGKVIALHPQLLTDFCTLESIAIGFFHELNRKFE